jgi:hypothetical protein
MIMYRLKSQNFAKQFTISIIIMLHYKPIKS